MSSSEIVFHHSSICDNSLSRTDAAGERSREGNAARLSRGKTLSKAKKAFFVEADGKDGENQAFEDAVYCSSQDKLTFSGETDHDVQHQIRQIHLLTFARRDLIQSSADPPLQEIEISLSHSYDRTGLHDPMMFREKAIIEYRRERGGKLHAKPADLNDLAPIREVTGVSDQQGICDKIEEHAQSFSVFVDEVDQSWCGHEDPCLTHGEYSEGRTVFLPAFFRQDPSFRPLSSFGRPTQPWSKIHHR